MTTESLDTADKVAMVLGGGLLLVGIVVIGFVETLVSPHTLEETSTTGDVIVHTAISPTVRAWLVALGLAVWLVYALYRLANSRADVAVRRS